ncbi:sugar phosphate isomerase/epimerase family protein [Clostridium lacusfryxellense]|uniref:sugar phosphate isomerase/epimerase family protein n=1 Tax=Clostridium lacusfryxellense TaxID=205328 RepID=UPI001C0A9580|nr:sugar phosphate isomerase/epimerase [Clostridium lacusfryxellense]MBU3113288.1 sugar phosphate isomerase/epimerase [Clostridium lacusfryxellense]
MKLGFVSAILGELGFEEVINYASENGFSCVEMMCWPVGKAERRYAGVTHIDVDGMDEKRAAYINDYTKSKGVEISALGYYPNPLDPDAEKSKFYGEHIKKIIKAANILGVKTVTTFIGKDKNKTVEENLIKFKEVWTPIINYAQENNVQIAIENCPMIFTKDEWPGGLNLATTPDIWRKMFKLIPNLNFGLNYDPSHFVWQQIDYIKPIYEFKDRIFHVHFKDIKIYKDKLDDVGIMATPLQYISPKLVGLGDVDWGKYVSALTDIGYRGFACIEVEDKAFEDSIDSIKESITISRNYMRQFII